MSDIDWNEHAEWAKESAAPVFVRLTRLYQAIVATPQEGRLVLLGYTVPVYVTETKPASSFAWIDWEHESI